MFILKSRNFLVPFEIRKGYCSMTPEAYGTHRKSRAPEHLELIKLNYNHT